MISMFVFLAAAERIRTASIVFTYFILFKFDLNSINCVCDVSAARWCVFNVARLVCGIYEKVSKRMNWISEWTFCSEGVAPISDTYNFSFFFFLCVYPKQQFTITHWGLAGKKWSAYFSCVAECRLDLSTLLGATNTRRYAIEHGSCTTFDIEATLTVWALYLHSQWLFVGMFLDVLFLFIRKKNAIQISVIKSSNKRCDFPPLI